jgi:hypothetical protein
VWYGSSFQYQHHSISAICCQRGWRFGRWKSFSFVPQISSGFLTLFGRAFTILCQILTYQDANRQSPFTWMLKCPFHLPYLTELHAEFPDATIVWTHRDPVECIASACSLYECIMKMVIDSWTVDRAALGAAVVDYTYDALNRAGKSIDEGVKAGTMKIIHVRYADNIKTPKDICKKVIESVSRQFSHLCEQILG